MADLRMGPLSMSVEQYKALHITAATTGPTPIGLTVNTTIAAALTAGSAVVITPASMANIIKGKRLSIVNGATTEYVTVLAVTGTTFTANLVNSYGTSSNLYSTDGTVLGRLLIGSAGSTMTLTLFNGLTGMLPKAGAAISVITLAAGPPWDLGIICEMGAFYTYTGTTAGDLTILYLDHPPSSSVF
jgi:hypothetical protein